MLCWTKSSCLTPQSIQLQKMLFCTVGEGKANQPDPHPEEQGLQLLHSKGAGRQLSPRHQLALPSLLSGCHKTSTPGKGSRRPPCCNYRCHGLDCPDPGGTGTPPLPSKQGEDQHAPGLRSPRTQAEVAGEYGTEAARPWPCPWCCRPLRGCL